MKFKLSRQIISPEIGRIIAREMRHKKADVTRASKAYIKKMAEVIAQIEKEGLPPHLVCKKMPHNLGSGIFLHPESDPILKGELIAPYSGEVSIVPSKMLGEELYAFTPIENIVLDKEEQAYFDKRRYSSKRLYTLKIDALKTGNFTRFVNHSEKPNVVAYLYSIGKNSYGVDPSLIEIVYFAKKTIHPGEQLLVCYEDEERGYWGTKTKPFHMTPKTFRLNEQLEIY